MAAAAATDLESWHRAMLLVSELWRLLLRCSVVEKQLSAFAAEATTRGW